MAKLLSAGIQGIQIAANHLAAGGVVGMPTETVYGLAGVAFNEHALAKIFGVKERPTFDPLILHIAPGWGSLSVLERMEIINPSALTPAARALTEKLIKKFWPGPLTLVLPKAAKVPDLATSGLATTAIRMPKHPIAQDLIRAVGQPLAAPSANRFGRISPTSAQDVLDELGDRIEFVINGGPCEVGLESTIVSIDGDAGVRLLRPGGTPISAIEAVTGSPLLRAEMTESLGHTTAGLQAPGTLLSHYAPRKNLFLLRGPIARLSKSDFPAKILSARGIGLILQSGTPHVAQDILKKLLPEINAWKIVSLSESGSLEEAAQRLFRIMRTLDQDEGVEVLLSEPCLEQKGLGHAISDRLKRASHSTHN